MSCGFCGQLLPSHPRRLPLRVYTTGETRYIFGTMEPAPESTLPSSPAEFDWESLSFSAHREALAGTRSPFCSPIPAYVDAEPDEAPILPDVTAFAHRPASCVSGCQHGHGPDRPCNYLNAPSGSGVVNGRPKPATVQPKIVDIPRTLANAHLPARPTVLPRVVSVQHPTVYPYVFDLQQRPSVGACVTDVLELTVLPYLGQYSSSLLRPTRLHARRPRSLVLDFHHRLRSRGVSRWHLPAEEISSEVLANDDHVEAKVKASQAADLASVCGDRPVELSAWSPDTPSDYSFDYELEEDEYELEDDDSQCECEDCQQNNYYVREVLALTCEDDGDHSSDSESELESTYYYVREVLALTCEDDGDHSSDSESEFGSTYGYITGSECSDAYPLLYELEEVVVVADSPSSSRSSSLTNATARIPWGFDGSDERADDSDPRFLRVCERTCRCKCHSLRFRCGECYDGLPTSSLRALVANRAAPLGSSSTAQPADAFGPVFSDTLMTDIAEDLAEPYRPGPRRENYRGKNSELSAARTVTSLGLDYGRSGDGNENRSEAQSVYHMNRDVRITHPAEEAAGSSASSLPAKRVRRRPNRYGFDGCGESESDQQAALTLLVCPCQQWDSLCSICAPAPWTVGYVAGTTGAASPAGQHFDDEEIQAGMERLLAEPSDDCFPSSCSAEERSLAPSISSLDLKEDIELEEFDDDEFEEDEDDSELSAQSVYYMNLDQFVDDCAANDAEISTLASSGQPFRRRPVSGFDGSDDRQSEVHGEASEAGPSEAPGLDLLAQAAEMHRNLDVFADAAIQHSTDPQATEDDIDMADVDFTEIAAANAQNFDENSSGLSEALSLSSMDLDGATNNAADSADFSSELSEAMELSSMNLDENDDEREEEINRIFSTDFGPRRSDPTSPLPPNDPSEGDSEAPTEILEAGPAGNASIPEFGDIEVALAALNENPGLEDADFNLAHEEIMDILRRAGALDEQPTVGNTDNVVDANSQHDFLNDPNGALVYINGQPIPDLISRAITAAAADAAQALRDFGRLSRSDASRAASVPAVASPARTPPAQEIPDAVAHDAADTNRALASAVEDAIQALRNWQRLSRSGASRATSGPAVAGPESGPMVDHEYAFPVAAVASPPAVLPDFSFAMPVPPAPAPSPASRSTVASPAVPIPAIGAPLTQEEVQYGPTGVAVSGTPLQTQGAQLGLTFDPLVDGQLDSPVSTQPNAPPNSPLSVELEDTSFAAYIAHMNTPTYMAHLENWSTIQPMFPELDLRGLPMAVPVQPNPVVDPILGDTQVVADSGASESSPFHSSDDSGADNPLTDNPASDIVMEIPQLLTQGNIQALMEQVARTDDTRELTFADITPVWLNSLPDGILRTIVFHERRTVPAEMREHLRVGVRWMFQLPEWWQDEDVDMLCSVVLGVELPERFWEEYFWKIWSLAFGCSSTLASDA